MWKQLKNMVNRLQVTPSSNIKKEIIAEYPELKELLSIVYSDQAMFGVTSEVIKKQKNSICIESLTSYENIILLLKDLSDRKITGNLAIGHCLLFLDNIPEDCHEIFYNLLDKNLQCRIDTKTLNEVWPGLIPEFSVALANDYTKLTKKPNFKAELWYGSRKLDGCRCLAFKIGDKVTYYSRTGKQFTTLENLTPDLLKLEGDFVLDGEIVLIKEGLEDFKGIVSEIKRKNHTIDFPKYMLFDILTPEEFNAKTSTTSFKERHQALSNLISTLKSDKIQVLEQYVIEDEAFLMEELNAATDKGWEGLILRKDELYKGKRSNDLLKVKKFYDAEYRVESIETGLIRIFEEGKESNVPAMLRCNIRHKGELVGVGSGWSIAERREFEKDPTRIIGKLITVKYFEESKDKNGKISLRFPVVRAILGETREV